VASGVVALARIEAARPHLIRQRLGLCARELRVLVAPLELCAELAVLLVHAPHILDLRPKVRHARRHRMRRFRGACVRASAAAPSIRTALHAPATARQSVPGAVWGPARVSRLPPP
jgi:hypothetical protein